MAPLLVFLDRHGIRYDLTSDLDLDQSRNPRASDRDGVLLAGSERWITRPLARRLRRYVLDGGNLAYFGADTLRRGLAITARGDTGTLRRPTEPTATDALGVRLEKPRTLDSPATLTQIDGDDPSFGLMTGVTSLPGFSELEEASTELPPRTKLLAGVGQELTDAEVADAERTGKPARELRSAFTAERLGKGLAIRVGLPEWPHKLKEPQVTQVTLNIADLLRGITPKIQG